MREAKEFCQRLGIPYQEALDPCFEAGRALYEENRFRFTDRKRLVRLNDEYRIFRKWFGDVLTAAEKLEADDDLLLYIAVLYAVIRDRQPLSVLRAPDWGCMETDFAPLYALLYFLEDMIADMQRRGVPADVLSDTLNGFDTEINDYYDLFGRSGMRRYVSWFLLFVYGKLLRVGRLQFEMTTFRGRVRAYRKGDEVRLLLDDAEVHRGGMLWGSAYQDDEAGRFHAAITEDGGTVRGYPANAWGECEPEPVTLTGYREALRFGDPVISVHIPSHAAFDAAACDDAFDRARAIFTACYPEHAFKAFVCYSWMMEKRLRQIMERDTNVTRFADRFAGFPLKSDGVSAVRTFLFHCPEGVPVADFPETTSMQRAVKAWLLDGKGFYEKGGLFF